MIAAVLLLTTLPQQVGTDPSLNEMATAQKACSLAGITYVQFQPGREVYVLIAKETYARRKEPHVSAAVACSAKIVSDRGYKPVVLGTKH